MKNPTLEQIKEMYPEGCEVACPFDLMDKEIIYHKDIIKDIAGSFSINNVYLYHSIKNSFATITKPALKKNIKNTMKNPTLQQIKEMYPEGCEVACVYTLSDKRIVKYSDLYESRAGGFYLIMNKKDDVFLFSKNPDRFATITKTAPKSLIEQKIEELKQMKIIPPPESEIQRIIKEYELNPLKLSPQNKNIKNDFNKAFNNRLQKMKEELIIDLIKYIDSL
jgi:hypothetical protein